ncbi:MAG: cyclic nucleotide-binding domain-containing protein [Acidobacteriota bacterium]
MDYSSFPLFRNLAKDDLAAFLSACREENLEAGTAFIETGSESTDLYFVLSGSLEVFRHDEDGSERQLAVLQAPAVVGEMEALTGDRRAASVRSREETLALVLPCATLRQRFHRGDPATLQIFLQITQVLARRLTAMNEKFVELQQTGAPVRDLQRFQQKLFSEWTF